MKQIVAILLVKNEDLRIRWVINNIVGFCDHIIVLDNHSTDRTWEIVKQLADSTDKITVSRWDHPKTSQEILRRYYGTDTWVFGVDGDEVFGPSGLAAMQEPLRKGEFDHVWRIGGNFLHCVAVDVAARTAYGYLAPPAREGVKLYNFKIVKDWKSHAVERLHGYPVFYKALI